MLEGRADTTDAAWAGLTENAFTLLALCAVVTVNAAGGGPEAVVSSDAFTELVPFEDTPSAHPAPFPNPAPPYTPFISAARASRTGGAPLLCAPPASMVTAAPFDFAARRAFFDFGCEPPQQQPRVRNQILHEAHKLNIPVERVEHTEFLSTRQARCRVLNYSGYNGEWGSTSELMLRETHMRKTRKPTMTRTSSTPTTTMRICHQTHDQEAAVVELVELSSVLELNVDVLTEDKLLIVFWRTKSLFTYEFHASLYEPLMRVAVFL